MDHCFEKLGLDVHLLTDSVTRIPMSEKKNVSKDQVFESFMVAN